MIEIDAKDVENAEELKYDRKLLVYQMPDAKFEVELEGVTANHQLRPMLRAAERALHIKLHSGRQHAPIAERPALKSKVMPTETGDPKPGIVTMKSPLSKKE